MANAAAPNDSSDGYSVTLFMNTNQVAWNPVRSPNASLTHTKIPPRFDVASSADTRPTGSRNSSAGNRYTVTAPSPKLAESESWAMLPTLATISIANAGHATIAIALMPPDVPDSVVVSSVAHQRRLFEGIEVLHGVVEVVQ